ncbi:MAG: DUF4159 domain-containing protein [Puniceicoccaceae bacterium]|nr:MAG: DUF4159 domain-containing protein [Puniceicoccaceae bacterium]
MTHFPTFSAGPPVGRLLAVLAVFFAPATLQAATAFEADRVRVLQLAPSNPMERNFPAALPSLLEHLNETTTIRVHPDPLFIDSFADERLRRHPLLYVNFGDRRDWTLSEAEKAGLKSFLERGGFLYLDAGITTEFLRDDPRYGQSHSFADWEIHPSLEELFRELFPDSAFERLPRQHPLFRSFHAGLPPPDELPDSVRDYVINEKWPQGTYSFLQLRVNGRTAVLASPIIAMGWGRTAIGTWANTISFRVRESAEGLDEQLREAAYAGARFEAVREDGRKDTIFCQQAATPSWVQEPNGRWRIFRYYHSREISDYAHRYYTQLGVNLFVYALTQ